MAVPRDESDGATPWRKYVCQEVWFWVKLGIISFKQELLPPRALSVRSDKFQDEIRNS